MGAWRAPLPDGFSELERLRGRQTPPLAPAEMPAVQAGLLRVAPAGAGVGVAPAQTSLPGMIRCDAARFAGWKPVVQVIGRLEGGGTGSTLLSAVLEGQNDEPERAREHSRRF